MVLALVVPFSLTSAAVAATPGITVTVDGSDEQYGGSEVVDEGERMTMRIQYSSDVAPGSTVEIALGDLAAFSVPDVPAGNDAIESIEADPDNPNILRITFADPWPPEVNQGVLALDFDIVEVERSSQENLTWSVDGEETSREITIRDGGDRFADVRPSTGKAVAAPNLAQFVTVEDGAVSVADEVLTSEITYTLSVDVEDEQSGYTITDQLPAELGYVEDSFAVTQITWDEAGLNKAGIHGHRVRAPDHGECVRGHPRRARSVADAHHLPCRRG
ncbi:hypothetical protein [Brevibacterium jeotgali]|uniref:DNA-directed RNA polymerase II subunit RPB1 n=1 Tax=Brevibacterium jeotgali TaxID=1262550 RepID=A0A2H1L466_9MICO|nr:hypothetical protein [Brevibacterium jeotgali]TWC01814.1 hypothetical protein FB108_0469 [Brevibacterium jeotgali]SMY11560.1 DNA-directed RNA polymerase II subunit RPB1 [Brevibacterium jeotgali]